MSSATPAARARVSGAEGLHARQLAAENRLRALGWRTAGVLLPPLAPIFWRKAAALTADTGRASVGALSEQTVVALLRDSPNVAAVLSGLHLSTRSREDVDQVVLMRSGAVAVVEVKTRRGFVSVVDGVLVSGRDQRAFHGDPLAQVTRGAGYVDDALSGLTVGQVHRVICVPDAPNRQVLLHEGIAVTTSKTLLGHLTSLPQTVQAVGDAHRALQAAHRRGRR